jgi:hypothetical protein
MKKIILLLLVISMALLKTNAQDPTLTDVSKVVNKKLSSESKTDSLKIKNWKYKAVGTLTGTQANFKNWNAGGQNTLSWIGLFDGNANWKKDKWSWMNGMNLAYGKNRIKSAPWAKTDDIISLNSKLGYNINKAFAGAFLADFKTQFDLGYDADNVFRSKFMAPGYLILALGMDYKPNEKFSGLIAPFTEKMTFVNDFNLANNGSYGVTADDIYNSKGFALRKEFGGYIKFSYTDEIMKNVTFKGQLELFSNYLHNPQNIDVNLKTLFNFKINKWLQASWSLNMIYDDDINISVKDEDGNVIGFGPRAQIKNVLSIGMSYTFIEK